ncbi:hypothetical protein [Streptomyces flavalbus]|uniref:PRC-barrel domain containing protein n=1 Tax=Streptomyces flavalbus TaxID=2665155 RepID=A0ABW2WJF7_9ACTN
MNAAATYPQEPTRGEQTPASYKPRLGDAVWDSEARRIGEVMDFIDPYVQLRPIGGGIEWDAKPGRLRPATRAEALSAEVSKANARSRGELL